ncbi:MAG: alanine racemase, partial [Myxococcota bacterium]
MSSHSERAAYPPESISDGRSSADTFDSGSVQETEAEIHVRSCEGRWPRVQPASDALRPTRIIVDFDAIKHNLRAIQHAIGDETKVLVVVKADAYGHGMVSVARRLQRENIFGFGVALAEEGLELRDAGVDAKVLVLNGVYGDAHAEVLTAGLTPVVYDLDDIDAFHRTSPEVFDVHLKIDTGMSRLGILPSDLPQFLEGLRRFPRCRIDGIMTHFASADTDEEATLVQLKRFHEVRSQLLSAGIRPRIVHAANSAATFRFPEAHGSVVRSGTALFGHSGTSKVAPDLRLAMRWVSRVIALRELPAGSTVGYGGTYTVTRRSRIATLPVGYGDGYLRSQSNRGSVLIGGRHCPVAGNVSMDLLSVDVTDAGPVEVGDEAVLLGASESTDRVSSPCA